MIIAVLSLVMFNPLLSGIKGNASMLAGRIDTYVRLEIREDVGPGYA